MEIGFEIGPRAPSLARNRSARQCNCCGVLATLRQSPPREFSIWRVEKTGGAGYRRRARRTRERTVNSRILSTERISRTDCPSANS
jgi:hypothetical protein